MATDIDQIQEQLNGKAHWDASEAEIREWLSEKFSIEGERADAMIAAGFLAKAAAIRRRSLMHLLLALVAGIVFGAMTWIALHTSNRITAKDGVLLAATVASLGYAGKNLVQLLSGKSDTAIDA